jgi:preprotein translocase subunit SecA
VEAELCADSRRRTPRGTTTAVFELVEHRLDVVKTKVTRSLMTVCIPSEEQVAQAAQALEQRAGQLANETDTHPNEDGNIQQVADRGDSRGRGA